MSNRASLINAVIAGLQQQINDGKDLARDLETQLRECNASRKATEEEAAELMKENAKLRKAISRIMGYETIAKDVVKHIFETEVGA